MEDISCIRGEYNHRPLESVSEDPFLQFNAWLKEAIERHVMEPTAMVLSTVTEAGSPASRMVLLKGLDKRGFSFFTNYDSAKGRQLDREARAALLFFWPELARQVRIEGDVIKLPATESDAYFLSRPFGSQISAVISPQSDVICGREELEEAKNVYINEFPNGPAERPDNWGGYILSPLRMEFWQGRPDRLHDRFQYQREGEFWRIVRLAP
ncbi:MAG: pyridoxamine 5'-phosphate oxidase [Bacteroidales bacterium]|nr:pyridoxamine 5'-phosphate oxidase [Bacteroidales bacterium]